VAALGGPLPAAGDVRLVFNATSLGMKGQAELDLDVSALPDSCVVFDAVYAPLETGLLRAARARGLAAIDGLEMLVGQAARAFQLFYGAPPPRTHDAELRALLLA
jgi:shikimate dehydrogenase